MTDPTGLLAKIKDRAIWLFVLNADRFDKSQWDELHDVALRKAVREVTKSERRLAKLRKQVGVARPPVQSAQAPTNDASWLIAKINAIAERLKQPIGNTATTTVADAGAAAVSTAAAASPRPDVEPTADASSPAQSDRGAATPPARPFGFPYFGGLSDCVQLNDEFPDPRYHNWRRSIELNEEIRRKNNWRR
jgi:hypothetical protein